MAQRCARGPIIKPRKLTIESLESRTLLSADVGLRYEFDLNGIAVTSLIVRQYLYPERLYPRQPRRGGDGRLAGLFQRQLFLQPGFHSGRPRRDRRPAIRLGHGRKRLHAGRDPRSGRREHVSRASFAHREEQLLFSVPIVANNAGTLTLSTVVDTSSGNTVITMFPILQPPTVSAMSDVEVDGLNSTTLSSNGSTVTGTIPVLARPHRHGHAFCGQRHRRGHGRQRRSMSRSPPKTLTAT